MAQLVRVVTGKSENLSLVPRTYRRKKRTYLCHLHTHAMKFTRVCVHAHSHTHIYMDVHTNVVISFSSTIYLPAQDLPKIKAINTTVEQGEAHEPPPYLRSYWELIKGERAVFFKGMAPSRMAMLQLMAPHQ